ncbi:glycosyltransferase family 2 protein [Citrobacter sp. OP27]
MQYHKNTKALIVLLNWNGAELTIDCCDSLLNLNTKEQDVFIVDNFSILEDYKLLENYLRENCVCSSIIQGEQTLNDLRDVYNIESITQYDFLNGTKILLARSLTNNGFSRGCNFGALVARALKYPEILLLNNDTVVENDFLEILQSQFQNNDIVIPQIRYFEPRNIIWNCGGEINRFGKRTYLYANKNASVMKLPNDTIPISFATGCCMLMRTDFYIGMGMFTEDFFFGEEDIDFALRLKKIKAKVVCAPQSIIYHKVGASLAGDLTKTQRKAFIHYLNRMINMKKHLGLTWYLWLIPAIIKMIINLFRLYDMNVIEVNSFVFKLLSASIKKNRVEKEYFEKIMNSGY